jgi:hypothetical protein
MVISLLSELSAYYEDGDGTPLSSPTIIYNYVFSINNPNTFDLVIEKNSYDSSIDENKWFYNNRWCYHIRI